MRKRKTVSECECCKVLTDALRSIHVMASYNQWRLVEQTCEKALTQAIAKRGKG